MLVYDNPGPYLVHTWYLFIIYGNKIVVIPTRYRSVHERTVSDAPW